MVDEQVCIDKNKIELSIICDSVYKPVCGCDNITYYNIWEAENKSGINIYSDGLCEHICTFNDTLLVIATANECTLLTDFINFYEVDYAPEIIVWEKDEYYLINKIKSNKIPSCGDETIHINCAILYDQSCTALIPTYGTDIQLPNDSLNIDEVYITNNCLNVNYSYLGGCDDTRLNLHHLIDSSTFDLVRLQLRYDNGDGPCTDYLHENITFNLSNLQADNVNSVSILIDCNGDDTCNEMITYEY
tara:strand:- start:265 stop:1002 length:738 start_codon:yes stop_codon:yes gene_type:complete